MGKLSLKLALQVMVKPVLKSVLTPVLRKSLCAFASITLLVCAQSNSLAQEPAVSDSTDVVASATDAARERTSQVAQESPSELPAVASPALQQQAPLDLNVASDGNVSQTGDILRLEDTIRGNKEQPKVLSIVPWQLPLHQRIDRNEQRWAPIKTQLKPLERNSFLKQIKLLDGIQQGQPDAVVDAQSR